MPQPCHNWIITYYHSLVFNNRIIRLIGTEFGIMLPNFRFLPEFIFAFDLKAVSTYERTITAEGKRKTSRTPVLPAEWKDQFGIPYEEHKKALQINMFDGFALFSLGEKQQSEASDQQGDGDNPNSGQPTDRRTL